MRLIILAANQGFHLDGKNKLLLKDPKTNKTILEKYLDLFKDFKVTVVVGYGATEIISEFPNLDYVYNPNWKTTKSSYSLSLALDSEPCVVLPSDLIFEEDLFLKINNIAENGLITVNSENRNLSATNCVVEDGKLIDSYQGISKGDDLEGLGIFKILDTKLLKQWKANCHKNGNLHALLNLPFQDFEVLSYEIENNSFFEINSVYDYINYTKWRMKND